DFGWMRPYLPIFMEGHIKNSLPLAMGTCGYRTVAVMPTRYQMVNEGPFLKSIGFQEVYDRDAVGAPSSHARDKLFYDFTTNLVSEHRAAKDPRPLFVFVQTMTTHGPYDEEFEPQEAVPGMPFGNTPEIDEFLRRMTLARQDYAPFLAAIDANKTAGGAVVLEYGDHQPSVTQASADSAAHGNAAGDWASPLYQTYYDVHAFGHNVDPFPQMAMDIGFLGATIADAAGLPGNEAQDALLVLRDRCRG
ncbi:sulfatase-like hydrolase/transferase, partial [Shinella sp. M27]|uniref:sulfatase-like hydrolase/transferase n=1 Tax=Shinella sp. M27 TaxID=3368614 RepID=UPI003BA2FD2B